MTFGLACLGGAGQEARSLELEKPTEQADDFDYELPSTDFNSLSTSECGNIKIAQFIHDEKFKDVQVKKLHELLQDDEVRATVLEQQGVIPACNCNAPSCLRVSSTIAFLTGETLPPLLVCSFHLKTAS